MKQISKEHIMSDLLDKLKKGEHVDSFNMRRLSSDIYWKQIEKDGDLVICCSCGTKIHRLWHSNGFPQELCGPCLFK